MRVKEGRFKIKKYRISNMVQTSVTFIGLIVAISLYAYIAETIIIANTMGEDGVFSYETLLSMGFLAAISILVITAYVHSLTTQNAIVKLLYKDSVTLKNNWLYFQSTVPKYIKKTGRKRKNKYDAIISLTLRKYQSYCACHSVDEGEKILVDIDEAVSSFLRKREVVARHSEASFAIYLCAESRTDCIRRCKEVLDGLNSVAPEHKLTFHMGIMPIQLENDKMKIMIETMMNHRDSAKDIIMGAVDPNNLLANSEYIKNIKKEAKEIKENLKKLKHAKLSVDQLYMYASTARDTLELKEDNGYALFDQTLIDDEIWEHEVADTMYQALENEEFKVYIQPKYEPSTKTLSGAEALVRWDSPIHGFVSPGRFIPVFEKNGFITKLDDYMIAKVADMQSQWIGQGYKVVPISVNVSRAHFLESELAEHICEIVDEYNAPHECIEIELTESAFFDDKKALLNTITKLQNYGFEVSMDDFGSGYSSLNSLRELPLDVLKLDAEFFRGDESNDERAKIVISEAIKLAKNLDMKIVAEGIEYQKQVEFLANEGCDMIQGYYFDKPMPPSEYMTRMTMVNAG